MRWRARVAIHSSAAPSCSPRRQDLSRGQRLRVPANRPPLARRAYANTVDATRLTGVVCAPPERRAIGARRFHSTHWGRFLYISGAAQRAPRTYASRPPATSRAGVTRCQWTHSPRDRFACACAGMLHDACAVYRQARTDLTKVVLKRDIVRCGQSGSRLGSTSLRLLRTVGHCPLHSDPWHSAPSGSARLDSASWTSASWTSASWNSASWNSASWNSKPSARTFLSRVVFPSGVFHSARLASAKLTCARLARTKRAKVMLLGVVLAAWFLAAVSFAAWFLAAASFTAWFLAAASFAAMCYSTRSVRAEGS
jgi:hypothetical protein